MAIQMSLNEEKQKEKQKQEQKQPVRFSRYYTLNVHLVCAYFCAKKLRTSGKLIATISYFSFRIFCLGWNLEKEFILEEIQ